MYNWNIFGAQTSCKHINPLKLLFEDLRIHWDSNSQNGSPLGSVWAHFLTFSHILKNVNVTTRLHYRPTLFHPYFGHEPKAKVVTRVGGGNFWVNCFMVYDILIHIN